MFLHLGHIHQLVRYPVKSMTGIATDAAMLGWHGVEGDRRFAFRRLDDKSHFPFLTAGRFPELILYEPMVLEGSIGTTAPTHVRTPEGTVLPIFSAELQEHIVQRFGAGVEMLNFKNGIFDDATVSVINLATVAALCREAGQASDARRFRANIVVATDGETPFLEDQWIGGSLVFGNGDTGPKISLTARDIRCMMINLDPDTAKQDPLVLKTAVRMNDNNAGAYGTVVRTGQLQVGQAVGLILEG